MPKFTIALLCGGPSLERAISLNSARTVLDHLTSDKIEILPVYFDHKKNAFAISRAQLYSNTPADFDFKLKQTSRALTSKKLIDFLKKVYITFPVIHGQFGEDGEIQKFLENHNLPFIGSSSAACRLAFDKHISNEYIKKKGFYTLPSLLLLKRDFSAHKREIAEFFKKHKIKRAIVKPAGGGSSIAVYSIADPDAALMASQEIFSKDEGTRVVLEPFCQGKEFTVIILENRTGQPVAILPTEIEMSYKDNQIFDYRRKYLANRQVVYHCPPRFSEKIIIKIQKQAEELFKLFAMRDFARFDGWLLPDGRIWFSDFNPISGMEQNSFLFMQSSRLGMSHRDLLQYVLVNSCRRQGISLPLAIRQPTPKPPRRKKINVIFGGKTAERQVSVMSGTNVWLKLKRSAKYNPQPYLLDTKDNVWRLPYTLTLNHTVEEITQTCRQAKLNQKRLKKLTAKIISRLQVEKKDLSEPWFLPEKMSLKKFVQKSPYVFIALHGGIGENGQLQKMLELTNKPFNGSDSTASELCMNKFATSQALAGLEQEGIDTAKKKVVELNFLKKFKNQDFTKYWRYLLKELGGSSLIVKPLDDGCSAGIARLYHANDLKIYLDYVFRISNYPGIVMLEGATPGATDSISYILVNKRCYRSPRLKAGVRSRMTKNEFSDSLRDGHFIPDGRLTNQHGIIEMPTRPMRKIMFEKFIATDKVQVINNKLNWQKNTGWIEITVGLLEKREGPQAFNPSLTVASGNVLTLEEKFQGGTGVNITPPPAFYVRPSAVRAAKIRTEKVAQRLGIKGYGRIDAFMNVTSGELIIIEANTLPALTPSTVIFHQALAETPPLYPLKFLEKIVGNNY